MTQTSAFPWRERLSPALIHLGPVATLATGMWMVAVGRPVHPVFEFDRFRMVRAIEAANDLLRHLHAGIRALPLGVWPIYRQSYSDARQRALAVDKPVSHLSQGLQGPRIMIDAALVTVGTGADKTLYLPMITHGEIWTVLPNADTAGMRTYFPLDSR